MWTKRAIGVLLCVFLHVNYSTASANVSYIGQHLCVSYAVVENTGSAGVLTRVELENTGSDVIQAGAWSIYHCSVRMITGLDKQDSIDIGHSGFKASHVNGCLFKFTPDHSFSGINPGETLTLDVRVNDWMVVKTDVMPNWYIADDDDNSAVITCTEGESLDFVTDFDAPAQYLRTPQDKLPKTTPEQRYDTYQKYLDDEEELPLERLVIPHPAQTDFSGTMTFEAEEWVVKPGEPEGLEAEVRLLSDKLGVSLEQSDDTRTSFTFQLRLSTEIQVPVLCSGEEELYKITVTEGHNNSHSGPEVRIEAVTKTGLFYAIQTLHMMTSRGSLPVGRLTDCARYSYRGVMVDLGRNFHSKDSMLALIQAMGTYKLNKLHLHLTDDEGWRLEIPGLPELTEIGSRRCHDTGVANNGNISCILPQLGSHPAGDDQGSGFYTVEEYKEILTAAVENHIEVIPEFDFPGHAHAAIKAMQVRAQRGDASFRLDDPDDRSRYLSVQMFTDNAVNPCISSTYKFMQHLVTEIQKIHKDIQPLQTFHFGGDEVAHTAWTQSPLCEDHSKAELKLNFTQELSKIVRAAGMKLAAWEDGVMDEHSQPYDVTTLENDDVTAYAWSNIWEWGQGDRAYRLANAGYKVVLSHATHLYFDHPSEIHPEERGYYWAPRFISAWKPFTFRSEDIYANIDVDRMGNPITKEGICSQHSCAELKNKDNIIGIQAQVWTETQRTRTQLESMLWPRLLAVAERAWYKASWEDITGADALEQELKDTRDFLHVIGDLHLRMLDDLGIAYRVAPPGAKVKDNNRVYVLPEITGMPILYKTESDSEWKNLSSPTTFDYTKSVVLAVESLDRTRRSREVVVPVSSTAAGSLAGSVRLPIGLIEKESHILTPHAD